MLKLGDLPVSGSLDLSDRRDRAKQLHLLGREAAFEALRSIKQCVPESIEKGTAGEPLWPANVVGSISHTGDWACAAAAPSSRCLAIGLDIEQLQRTVSYDVAKRVCTTKEQEQLALLPDELQRDLWFKRIFSVKECIFKALYPLCQTRFWFKDAQLSFEPDTRSRVQAELIQGLSDQLPEGLQFPVSLVENETHVLSYIALTEL